MLIVVITGRVEMEGLAKIFFKKWGYYLTLILLIISLQATIISSVIISAQVGGTQPFELRREAKARCNGHRLQTRRWWLCFRIAVVLSFTPISVMRV